MKSLNRATQIYIVATYAVASTILIVSLRHGSVNLSSEFLMLALIGAVMSPHTVRLAMRVEMSISHPFILASMIVLGETESLLMSVICIGSLCYLRSNRLEHYRSLFNIASFVITMFITSRVYHFLGGVAQDPGAGETIMSMMVATLVFYLANTFGVSGAVALHGRLNLFKTWHEHFLWSAPSFFAGGSLALGMAFFLDRFGVNAFILAMPFCVLIDYSYKLYLDKLEEKKQHLEDIRRMNADLERKVRERTAELQVLNEKLRESNEQLKRASSLKSEFLANMSHELRTPLNAIIGFSELLLDRNFGKLSDDQSDYVMDILSSGRHLLDLINDILDLSKIEAGKMKLSFDVFDLGDAVEEAMALLRVEASRKRIELSAPGSEECIDIQADRNKLKQILHNLLSNAIKFTASGGRVILNSTVEGENLRVEVTDTGIGIEPEECRRIFDAFIQVDGSYSRKYQGTGLGLALVRKFVDMHGGRVWVESEVGRGSRFIFTIPTHPPGEDRQTPAEPAIAQVAKGGVAAPGMETANERAPALILAVEDNPTNMKLVCDLLRSHGHRVIGAVSAEEALDALKFVRPDLILMDIQLPGMDGLELTRLLKENAETARIPVIAISAHAMKEDEKRSREAGCAGFLAKPIDTTRFVDQIASFLPDGKAVGAR